MKRPTECFADLKGHDFSRAANTVKRTGALAPEGFFSRDSIALRFEMKASLKTVISCVLSSLFFAIVLTNSTPCLSQDSAQLKACMQKAMDQTSMNSCANKELARIESELKTVYEKLLSKAKRIQGAAAKLEAEEKAWIQYRDAYLEALYPAEDKQRNYGTIYPMEYAQFRSGMTQEHIKALKDMTNLYDEETESL